MQEKVFDYVAAPGEVFDQTQLPAWESVVPYYQYQDQLTFNEEALPKRRPVIQTALVIGGLALTSVVLGGVDVSQPPQKETVARTAECDAPSQTAYKAVDGLLNRTVSDYVSNDSAGQATVFNLTADLTENSKNIPFSVYLKRANDFLKPAGVTVRMAEEADFNISGGTVPSKTMLDGPAKSSLVELMIGLADVPRSLIRQIGLETIVLAAYLPDGDSDTDVLAQVSPIVAPGTITADISNRLTAQTWTHELYHLLDYKQCGEFKDADPAYTRQNQVADYDVLYEADAVTSLTDINQQTRNGDIRTIDGNAMTPDAQCDEVRRRLETAEMLTDYSYSSPTEDKAELGANIFQPGEYAEVMLTTPRLAAKFRVLLARLYDFDPASTAALIGDSHLRLMKERGLKPHLPYYCYDIKS